ncbi:MAG: right-handed parallel beta-helix repeat-containing protein [Candidatus Omnitrophota bacterium]
MYIDKTAPILLVIVFCLIPYTAAADDNPYAVPTYECIGVYYQSPDRGECRIRYRRGGKDSWRESLGLVYDKRDGEYRGSLVGLTPDAEYEIELISGNERPSLKCRTKNNHIPIGQTTVLSGGVSPVPLSISESGVPGAYHLIASASGETAVIDVMNSEDCNVVIDADYIVLRGLELKNAERHGVLIKRGRHDIVVEDCRITGWGRMGGPITYGNDGIMDSGVFAEKGAGNLTIQRNLIEHPRGASNDWDTGHPNGPQGISLIDSSGGNVIRWNELRSTEDHGFNDGFGGGSNFSFEGSPNRDSDIYGNIITNVWDDAIESEGANMNVRIWGNFLDYYYHPIATACVSKGPIYIFRNIFGVSRRTHADPLGGAMIKTGERDEFGGGRRFIFHNTALQPRGAFSAFSGHIAPNVVTRNNIFHCPGQLASRTPADPPGDYDYDLFTGMDKGLAKEPHGLHGKPAIEPSRSLEFYPAPTTTAIQWGRIPFKRGGKEIHITDPVIVVPNPIIDAGTPIPGFNDDYAGKAPDLGAFELGRLPLRFGRQAGAAAQ